MPRPRPVLEVLVEHLERNFGRIETIRRGETYGSQGWFIINRRAKRVIPPEVYAQARSLYRENNELMVRCQREAFEGHEWIQERNRAYSHPFMIYDVRKDFSDQLMATYYPFPESREGGSIRICDEIRDEIGNNAVRRYSHSEELLSILTRVIPLYEQAIAHLKQKDLL